MIDGCAAVGNARIEIDAAFLMQLRSARILTVRFSEFFNRIGRELSFRSEIIN